MIGSSGAASTDAARVPADVLASARAVIKLADELLPVANRAVISDVAAAAEAARAAAATARVNVEVNLPGIPQSDARIAFIDALTIVDATVSHADRITTQVRKQLNS